jgi:2-keto-4-pentenoate hydratase/2-oxohepta-3-ene-1,7-dioic acid hydratase in catechol pathway
LLLLQIQQNGRLAKKKKAENMTSIHFSNKQITVGKLVCVGANFSAHNAEMGRESKPESFLFIKPATALVDNDVPIEIPPFTTNLHHEVEMVLLIGRKGRRIPLDSALDYVDAVSAGLDLTARDLQARAKEHGLPWSMSKAFDGSARVAPFISIDKVDDLNSLDLSLVLNGKVKQQGNTRDMLLSAQSLIQFASRFFTLEPGDLLFCGTPAGVGPLKEGDVVEIDLGGGLTGAEFRVQEEQDVSKC